MTAIGIHVHAQSLRLLETLAALHAHTAPGFELLLLPDGPDPQTRTALARLPGITQSATDAPLGPAACFNRLTGLTTADTIVLLESGTLVSPDWLEILCEALAASPRHGLACPSTNRAWNQLAVFPGAGAASPEIARTAAEAAQRFGRSWRSLAPLWDVADFCLAAKREAVEAAGPADEGYGLGPCWEMDYAVRVVRAGYVAVWAQSAYVFRHPFTPRRQREEARLFEASRRRYQDAFCGERLSGERQTYASSCRGEACPRFAPTAPPSVSAHAPAPVVAPSAAPATARPTAPVNTDPLVSCIMPTRQRPEWMNQAIHYFQQQDYANRELVIVDGSPQSLAPSLADDPRIRHIHAPWARSIGTMRNLACEAAHGELIVHWDDDDWYAQNRITAQVRPILDGIADVTGLRETVFFDLHSWMFWRCTPAHHRRLFVLDVHGGTLAFRRSLHGAGSRYPEVSLAEDAFFLQQIVTRGARLLRLSGKDIFIYLRHGANAWAFPVGRYLDPAGWQQAEEPGCLAGDRSFYAGRSGKHAPAPPGPAPPPVTASPSDAGLPAPCIVSDCPLVSCIMPTNGRRRFVPHAVRQFLQQDYRRKELIVIDDGDDAVADLMPQAPEIRYVRESIRRRVGGKRNAACEIARGEVVAHWDDDDWYAPWRLSYQVAELDGAGALLCGLDRMLFLDEAAGNAWEYVYPQGGSPWLYGATLCYRHCLWQRNRFTDINVGEDAIFVSGAARHEVRVLERREFYVGRMHPGNVSPKQTRDPRWRPAAYAVVRALIG